MSQDGDNIFVCCRARPRNERERAANATDAVVLRPETNSVELPTHTTAAGKAFTFDRVFAHNTAQEQVFADVAVPVIKACLAGYNGTIFAYGQTGSGKTYTVMGPTAPAAAPAMPAATAHSGLLPRILFYVFDELDKIAAKTSGISQFSYECRFSYLEIYNENIFDLASGSSSKGGGGAAKSLQLRESAASGVYVEGVQEVVIDSASEVLAFVYKGNHARHGMFVAALSHATFVILVVVGSDAVLQLSEQSNRSLLLHAGMHAWCGTFCLPEML
jgi:kinesin family protein 15